MSRRCLVALVLLSLTPFLCGFSFYSALKNQQGNKLYKKGAFGKAKLAYLAAQKSDPKSPFVAFNLGNAYYKEEMYDKSLESYKKAARDEKSPSLQALAFYNLGNSLARTEQIDQAIEFYKQALRLDPKDGDAKYNLQILMKKKQDQKQDQKKQPNQQQQKNQQNQQQNKQGQSQQGSGQQQNNKQGEEKKQQAGASSPEESKDQNEQGQEKKQEEQAQKQEGKEGQQQKQVEGGEKQQEGQESQKLEGGEKKQGEQQETQAQPVKTQGQIRAEQILEALENQEKQVIKLKGGEKGPVRRQQYLVDKDW